MINKDSVRHELAKLLASRTFEGKRQACNFLEYVVMEALEGRGERISQYGIAVESLGKSPDYCPTENPAVRVEAGRLRKLLDDYYANECVDPPLRIRLPVGSYTPVFEPVIHRVAGSGKASGAISEKSVQSVGPRIYISCQNPASIRDDAARNLVYTLSSSLPMILGKFRELRIALIDHTEAPRALDDELRYAWQQHQAEFLLRYDIQVEAEGFLLSKSVIHTISGEQVWGNQFHIPRMYAPNVLEALHAHMITQAFSLNQGVVLNYWSRYWRHQESLPAHYRVLVEHIHFIQEDTSEHSFQLFLRACQERTEQYHDDALAHLHFAILCLYATMMRFPCYTLPPEQWRQLTLKALTLNPGNALAHGIFALECYQRGDLELCQMEMSAARRTNPFDTACGHLLAVGLCALRNWRQSMTLLTEVLRGEYHHPEPLLSVPCLYYFRQGHFIRAASQTDSFAQLGGWETFGALSERCRAEDCNGCIQRLGQAVSQLDSPSHFSFSQDLTRLDAQLDTSYT